MALRRLATSVVGWSVGPPLAINLAVPAFASLDLVYAPLTVAASLTVATIPIGLALGAVRGACSAGEYLLVPSVGVSGQRECVLEYEYSTQNSTSNLDPRTSNLDPRTSTLEPRPSSLLGFSTRLIHPQNYAAASVAGNAEAEQTATQLRSHLQSALRGDTLVGSVLTGSGLTGVLARGMMSIFLPATDVFVERVVGGVETAGASQGNLSTLVRASCDGVVLGNTSKVRDTASGLGALAYAAVFGLAVASDRAADAALGGGSDDGEGGNGGGGGGGGGGGDNKNGGNNDEDRDGGSDAERKERSQ